LSNEISWKSIPKEQVNFEVAPKDYCTTYNRREFPRDMKQHKSYTKDKSQDGKGWNKPGNAIYSMPLKELGKLIEKMVDMNTDLENSKNNIDATVEHLQNQIQKTLPSQRLRKLCTR
jgi:hypothetical protein